MPSLLSATLLAAAMALPGPAPQAERPTKPRTLSGCVSRSSTPQDPFRFAETGTGERYRLTGKGLGKYVGRQVEIVGGAPGRKVTIRGGLLPSPNVAAQAGAMDPAKVAVANMPGATAGAEGSLVLPEFHVTRVRLLDGECR